MIGDPTEAALVVLAAKMGVDAETDPTGQYPRAAEVPFDSAYKFMATFHDVSDGDDRRASSSSSRAGRMSCSSAAPCPGGR